MNVQRFNNLCKAWLCTSCWHGFASLYGCHRKACKDPASNSGADELLLSCSKMCDSHCWSVKQALCSSPIFESSSLRLLGVCSSVYCLSVCKLFICMESLHWHALLCQQNHCCIYVGSLQVLLSSWPKCTKKLWDCILLAEPLALAFKWILLPDKRWGKHFAWKTLVGAMVCNYSPYSGVETSERNHWNIVFCSTYLGFDNVCLHPPPQRHSKCAFLRLLVASLTHWHWSVPVLLMFVSVV